jgi:hypothetical protein
MTFKKFFYENEKQELKTFKPITVTYKTADGVIKQEVYSGPDSEQKARDFIEHWVGLNGEIGEGANYIVSDDGVGIVAVKGIDISDLLGRQKPSPALPDGYTRNLIQTTMMLNFPRLLNYGKLSDESFMFDFSTGIMNKFKQKELGRLLIQVKYDDYDSTLWLSLNIFSYFQGDVNEKRFYKSKYIEPSRDFHKDLKTVESFFLEYEDKIREVENYIKDENTLKN